MRLALVSAPVSGMWFVKVVPPLTALVLVACPWARRRPGADLASKLVVVLWDLHNTGPDRSIKAIRTQRAARPWWARQGRAGCGRLRRSSRRMPCP